MKCTYRAAELLKGNKKLKVHSVYRHTVNVAVNGRILAFHRDTIPSTPLSLALPFTEEEFEHFEREAKRTGQINMHISHEDGRLFSSIETQQNETVNFCEAEELSAKLSDRYCWINVGNFKQNAGKIILWEDRLDRQAKPNQLEKSGLESESQKLNSVKSESENYLKKDCMNQENKNMIENILSVLLPELTQNYQLGGFSDCAVTTEKRKDDSFITQILREKTAAILSKDILGDTLKNNETNFERLICSFIGLGPGLTPSGDDFLTGILLAFSLEKNIKTCIETDIGIDIRENTGAKTDRKIVAPKTKYLDKKHQQICKVVSENLDRTNDISKEYLLCAMENRFGELYHKLQEELYHSNVPEDIFCRIIHTGHSSGLDTLNGLAVGLKMIRTMNLKQQD